jgi:hypothetical protein
VTNGVNWRRNVACTGEKKRAYIRQKKEVKLKRPPEEQLER